MGCTSTKHGATKTDEAKTLLTSSPRKQNTSDKVVTQFHVAQAILKEHSLAMVMEIITNPGTTQILEGVDGLTDAQILLASENKLILQATVQSDNKASTAESKIGEVLKLLEDAFEEPPMRFIASGGNVQLTGQPFWSLKKPVSIHHTLLRAVAAAEAATRIPEILNSEPVLKKLSDVSGIIGLDVYLELDQKLRMHAQFMSKQAFNAGEHNLQEVAESLNEALEDKQQRFHAFSGPVQAVGEKIWSLATLPRQAAPATVVIVPEAEDDHASNNEQFADLSLVDSAGFGENVLELVVQPAPADEGVVRQTWFLAACCSPSVVQA